MAENNSNPWTALFGGAKLLNHNGDSVDPTTFTNKKGVLLYFSAHWCPPCRGFTPVLAEYHKSHHEKFNFETVFVSSDKDEAAFNEYWGSMPWLALPFAERSQKEALSRKFKVQGIPTLVVLDGQGNTITTGARGKVQEDPEGFPWVPKTFDQILAGNVKNGKDEDVSTESLKSNTAIGIYFSAHWCPPCRSFTPKLVETYNKIKAAGKKFEIIFASSDQSEDQFKEYFHEMPWLAFPFKDKRIAELSDLYDVEGIPTFVIIDPATGKTINASGRSAVDADPNGDEFPWNPKPLNSIESAGSELNDEACLIYLNTNLTDEIKSNLNKVAESYHAKWKAEGKEQDKPLHFFVGGTGNLAKRIKEFLKIENDPVLIILKLQENVKDIHSLPAIPSEEDFKTIIEKFLSNKQ
jgi:nucleoredoxin